MSKQEENNNKKLEQLEQFKKNGKDQPMTTNNGTKVSEDELTLTAGERGPSLLEDFHFREKLCISTMNVFQNA